MHPFRFHSRDEGCSYNGFVKRLYYCSFGNKRLGSDRRDCKVIFYETRLYVATFSPEQAVYIFNLQGKLLHKISRKGRGAEEYLQLSDMFIDSRNRTLNLLSRIDEKLLVFDVDEYRLVKTIRLPKAFVKGLIGKRLHRIYGQLFAR